MSVRDSLQAPTRGKPITARFLGQVVKRIDSLDDQVRRRPRTSVNSQQLIAAPGATDLGPLQLLDPDLVSDQVDRDQLGLVLRETSRTVTIVRVENPDDAAQFVDVERIDQITFQGDDGTTVYTLVLNND